MSTCYFAHTLPLRSSTPLARRWLITASEGAEPLAVPNMVLLGFVRIATNPGAFVDAMTPTAAFDFCAALKSAPAFVPLVPGVEHWRIFQRAAAEANIRGRSMSDAHLAAFSIANEAEFVSFDRGFARFPGLRWSEPPPL